MQNHQHYLFGGRVGSSPPTTTKVSLGNHWPCHLCCCLYFVMCSCDSDCVIRKIFISLRCSYNVICRTEDTTITRPIWVKMLFESCRLCCCDLSWTNGFIAAHKRDMRCREAQMSVMLTLWPHCCYMGTAIKHPVPDRIKPSFVIFDIRALWRSELSFIAVPIWQQWTSKG